MFCFRSAIFFYSGSLLFGPTARCKGYSNSYRKLRTELGVWCFKKSMFYQSLLFSKIRMGHFSSSLDPNETE